MRCRFCGCEATPDSPGLAASRSPDRIESRIQSLRRRNKFCPIAKTGSPNPNASILRKRADDPLPKAQQEFRPTLPFAPLLRFPICFASFPTAGEASKQALSWKLVGATRWRRRNSRNKPKANVERGQTRLARRTRQLPAEKAPRPKGQIRPSEGSASDLWWTKPCPKSAKRPVSHSEARAQLRARQCPEWRLPEFARA